MKNNKGFTLVELMAVIVVLAIIISIAVASAISISRKVKENMYETKVDMIISSAKIYGQDHPGNVGNSEGECSLISIQTLIDEGYIKKDKDGYVQNPIDNSSMNNLQVCIYKNNNRFYAKKHSTSKNAWANDTSDNYQKLYIFKNGVSSGYSIVNCPTCGVKNFVIGTTISFNSNKNNYLYYSNPIANGYKSLKLKVKATGPVSNSWGRLRVGIRPITGSDGSSNFQNYFIPNDWIKMVEAVTNTTNDTGYRIVTLDLSNVTNSQYYVFMHAAGVNFSISEIWFE